MGSEDADISNPMEADPGKMFIGGLHSQTTQEGLQRYFEQYGEVKECVVMRDSVTKRSRGFGFVRFADSKSVDKVSNASSHSIDGKKIDPKRAIPKRPPPGQNQFKKVFVGGLPPDTTPNDIKDYFEGFGKVNEVLLMHDRNTKRLRGFGFVTFESDQAGKHVCETGFHKLKGKSVECKRAQPKEVMMLQGKGRGLIVNFAPFPFGRGYPALGGPMGFGFPDFSLTPQIYQNLANIYTNAMYGRGRGFGGYIPQGFVNMPEHRRLNANQYFSDYVNHSHNDLSHNDSTTNTQSNSVTTQDIPITQSDYGSHHYSNVHMSQYGSQPSNVGAPPHSPLSQTYTQVTSLGSDMGAYLHSTRHAVTTHDGHLTTSYNNHPHLGSLHSPFNQGMSQITIVH